MSELISNKLFYLSQPSRLGGNTEIAYRNYVVDTLLERGFATVHPFEAFPYSRFEGHPLIGRELALRYCCNIIDACDGGIIVSGISEGVLHEVNYFRQQVYAVDRAVVDCSAEFDSEYQKYSEAYREQYAEALGYLALNAVEL